MATCAACGVESPPGFRFCGACGAALAGPPAQEARKAVTVVFCDVTGSTALGERLDPESLRRVLARYFDVMRAAIERHGGTVEKFVGDAVLAVFGVPQLHEDDALRALRAATDMRDGLGDLNAELERDYGTTLELRIGVNTGQVVTGTAERLVTGDAVNVAARLEQAARPGETLIGAETVRVSRHAIQVEELPPLELKGKASAVRAYRLVQVAAEAGAIARNLDAPMVGRERERRLLAGAWERIVSERTCLLFTLLGAAGVGKSRLVADFRQRLDAAVVEGRCLSYGEGVTYWPVVEIVKQLPPLADLGLDREARAALDTMLGESNLPTTPEQIAWAVRRLLEAAAARRPLLVVFDDVQWGEPAFLALIRHVADLSRGAPILLLCAGRPELLERAPDWGGGALNATTVLLEPLSPDETLALVDSLGVEGSLRGRIAAAAEGNPLFVEEMVALASENGAGEVVVPPTVQALLAARLDQLDASERRVLARGAIEGQVFHLGAVRALAPEEPEPQTRVAALVRKELVRPEQATLPAEEAYRFRHLLIRDAAYDALPKATRAELHERFAGWLDEHGRDLVERDEIVGYHLEQACRYRAELGPLDAAAVELRRHAAVRLTASGRAALLRQDVAAASALLRRASALLPDDDPLRADVLVDLAEALYDHGRLAESLAVVDDAVALADARADTRALAAASLRRLTIRAQLDSSAAMSELLAEVDAMLPGLTKLDDDALLARAWTLRGRLQFFLGLTTAAGESFARAVDAARRADHVHLERDAFRWWASAKRYGAAPAEEALAFLASQDDAATTSGGLGVAHLSAALLAMGGHFEEARAAVESVDRRATELGLELRRLSHKMEAVYVELLAGETERAAEIARESFDGLGRLGESGFRATVGTMLAEALAELGRDEEAEQVLRECETIALPEDFDPQARSRLVRALLLARRNRPEEAVAVARDAVAIMAATDYDDLKAWAFVTLARVLRAAGRGADAAEAFEQAVALFEHKGNVVGARLARERLRVVSAA